MSVELEARIRVLEKLCEKIFDALAEAKVAGKTADKALQMAQEAIALVLADKKQAQEPADPFGMDPFQQQNDPYMMPMPPGQVVRLAETLASRKGQDKPAPEPDFTEHTDDEMTELFEQGAVGV